MEKLKSGGKWNSCIDLYSVSFILECSLLPLDFEDDMIITSDVSRYIEDPGFGYEDFARRGEEHLPTFRAQVEDAFCSEELENKYCPLTVKR